MELCLGVGCVYVHTYIVPASMWKLILRDGMDWVALRGNWGSDGESETRKLPRRLLVCICTDVNHVIGGNGHMIMDVCVVGGGEGTGKTIGSHDVVTRRRSTRGEGRWNQSLLSLGGV